MKVVILIFAVNRLQNPASLRAGAETRPYNCKDSIHCAAAPLREAENSIPRVGRGLARAAYATSASAGADSPNPKPFCRCATFPLTWESPPPYAPTGFSSILLVFAVERLYIHAVCEKYAHTASDLCHLNSVFWKRTAARAVPTDCGTLRLRTIHATPHHHPTPR